jgi:hypothetical protein
MRAFHVDNVRQVPYVIDSTRFHLIKRRHGACGSWAVWAPPSGAPKSNMGDLQILNEHANPALLETLNPRVVMVGLNISRGGANEPFRNFHDPSPVANDFKIRYAFRDTGFWGAYMTDVIKGVVEPVSGTLLNYLRKNPVVVRDHVKILRSELLDLGCPQPVILAFGGAAHALLKENLSVDDYSLLVPLTHYSHRISKEKYRDTVHRQILHARQGTAQPAACTRRRLAGS